MGGDSRGGSGVNACKTLAEPENTRSATPRMAASRFELPLLGSNQDSPDPESGVLPVTPRGIGTKPTTDGRFGLWKPEKTCAVRGTRLPPTIVLRHRSVARHRAQPRTANRAPCLKTCLTGRLPATKSNRAPLTAHHAPNAGRAAGHSEQWS